MLAYDGSTQREVSPIRDADILNPAPSPTPGSIPVHGATVYVHSQVTDVVVRRTGEPMLPARWDAVESVIEAHFQRYESVMERLS